MDRQGKSYGTKGTKLTCQLGGYMKRVIRIGPRNVHVVVWETSMPKGVVQLIHGMVEHIGRYEGFAQFLNEKGYHVIGHDHIGHGESVVTSKEYGVFPRDEKILIEDTHLVLSYAKENYPTLPYIMLGHSMGSFVLRQYLTLYQPHIQGAIIMGTGKVSPFVAKGGITLAKLIRFLKNDRHRSKILEQLSTGSLEKAFGKGAAWLSRDVVEVEKYAQDIRCNFKPTVNMHIHVFYLSGESNRKKNMKAIPSSIPLLLISGQEDPLGDFGKGIQDLYTIYQRMGKDITCQLYPKMRHEILNEIDKEEVMEDIASWIEEKIKV